MEINYDVIIKYLSKKTSLVTPKNIFNYSTNFTEEFKNLFFEGFYRYGILVYDNDNNNISLWSSLVTILDKSLSSSNDISEILDFKNEILQNINTSSDTAELLSIVNHIDINIFVFDFVTCNICALYNEEQLNPIKHNIFLAKVNDIYEPIMFIKKNKIQRMFNSNDAIIKKILQRSNIVRLTLDGSTSFSYIKTLEKIVAFENQKLDTTQVEEFLQLPEDLVYNKEPLNEKINKTILNKMKLEELVEYASKKNIIIKLNTENKKQKYELNKIEIINLILNTQT